MTDIAMRVDNPCPEFGRRISKLCPARSLAVWRSGVGWARHLGALHQRPDTASPSLTHLRRRRLRPGSTSLRDALTGAFARIRRNGPPLPAPRSPLAAPPSDDLWALKDVSFVAQRGEVVGSFSGSANHGRI